MAVLVFWAAASSVVGAEPTLIALDRDPLLERAIFSRMAKAPDHHVRFAASGAASSNVDFEHKAADHWFIESQRGGAELVEAGLVSRDRDVEQMGWKILDWGFARQKTDGGFGDTGDPFHSTSFFVEAAARSVLLARQTGDPSASRLAAHYGPKIAAAAAWMRRPEVLERGLKNNQPYTHRRWLVAATWGLAADVTHNTELARAAAESARDGLALQRPDGVNPEKQGFDVSYQAVGLLFAARYDTVCHDAALRASIRDMLQRGLAWTCSKIDADGAVQVEGSTRVTTELARSGAAKTVDYRAIVTALVYGARLTNRPEFYDAAGRVARHVHWIKDE